MNDVVQSWPLYVVTDLRDREGPIVAEVVYDGSWSLRRRPPHLIREQTPNLQIRELLDLWLSQLEDEISAANGAENGATPLSVARMEWRRAFHNNNLRIGSAETRSSPAIA